MEAIQSERRAATQARMPVTMSVELGHDGWDETYEADAINVSTSGIGVRAPMLPDVGQRMRCRFQMPDLSGSSEAEGEVVWASDAGDAGEFGIRFDALDPKVSEVLARWVSTLEQGRERPSTEPGLRRPSVKVQLDGVASPIEAEVAVADGHRVRVEQALPFLLIGTKATVSEGGQRGVRRVLRSVELRIDGAVPRLVLELESSQPDVAPESTEGPATVADAPIDELLAASAVESVADVPSTETAPAIAAPAPKARRPREDDSPRAVRLSPRERAEERDALAELGVNLSGEEEPEPLAFVTRLREVKERATPTLARLVLAMKASFASMIALGLPKSRALGGWLLRVSQSVKERIAARWPAIRERLASLRPNAAPKRRVTMAPPTPEAKPAKKTEAAPELPPAPRPRLPLRYVLAGVAVLAATVLAVRSFTAPAEAAPIAHEPTLASTAPSESAPADEGTLSEGTSGEGAEAAVLASVPLTVLAAEPSTVTETTIPAPTTEVAPAVLPGTLAASSGEAGRLSAPTFPAVGSGAPAADESAVEAPADEPLPRTRGRLTFGAADVPHGRSTTLTMTLPITTIEGEATDSGFTVNLPGVNSLSRAAPIAAANPSVERAAILNSGDHAVLTIRFVPGRTPAYRVEARGTELVVTIGR